MSTMSGYTKLFSSIIASTIWREDNDTRIVWITMLAMADRYGIVEASVPGLADMARVTVDGARRSIVKLSSPDPDSRSHEHAGRRIEEIEGGWRILNHARYREKLNEDDRREYQRKWQAARRAKKAVDTPVENSRTELTEVDPVDTSRSRVQKQSTEADTHAEAPLAPARPRPRPLGAVPNTPAMPSAAGCVSPGSCFASFFNSREALRTRRGRTSTPGPWPLCRDSPTTSPSAIRSSSGGPGGSSGSPQSHHTRGRQLRLRSMTPTGANTSPGVTRANGTP